MASQLEPHLADPSVQRPPVSSSTLKAKLGARSIVIIGMMGAGKSSIGRRLAHVLGLTFVDSDDEIEKAANMTIPEIFTTYGEAFFRDGERKVIDRLLSHDPCVLAVGGGAFENPQTRQAIKDKAISIWLKADLEVLMARVRRRSHRPLLQTGDPEATMKRLLKARDPNYALADLTVISGEGAHADVVDQCLDALAGHLQ